MYQRPPNGGHACGSAFFFLGRVVLVPAPEEVLDAAVFFVLLAAAVLDFAAGFLRRTFFCLHRIKTTDRGARLRQMLCSIPCMGSSSWVLISAPLESPLPP